MTPPGDDRTRRPAHAASSGVPVRVTGLASMLLAPNPGPMTLDGTRSYILAAPGARTRVVVDPGPDDVAHLTALADGPRVEVVLITHRHADHTAGAARFAELTGDTVLGRGTTVIAEPDGSLRDYLTSLDALESIGAATVLPAHGPHLGDLSAVVRTYREHRAGRLAQVRTALGARAGDPVTEALVDDVTASVYGDVVPGLLSAARQSVRAQLRYLAEGA